MLTIPLHTNYRKEHIILLRHLEFKSKRLLEKYVHILSTEASYNNSWGKVRKCVKRTLCKSVDIHTRS